jgi:hypothetical protein
MARAMDWVQYDKLKGEGYSQRAIALALGIPESTLRDLLKRGRPPSQGPSSTIHPATDDRPPPTVDHVPSTVDHLQATMSAALTAALQPVMARLEALETGLVQRSSTGQPSTIHHPPDDRLPSPPDTSTMSPSTVDRETWEFRQLKHSERWTVYVPRAMKDDIKRRAAARGVHHSLLVQEALARWLAEEHKGEG